MLVYDFALVKLATHINNPTGRSSDFKDQDDEVTMMLDRKPMIPIPLPRIRRLVSMLSKVSTLWWYFLYSFPIMRFPGIGRYCINRYHIDSTAVIVYGISNGME